MIVFWLLCPVEVDLTHYVQHGKAVRGFWGVYRLTPSFLRTTVVFQERCWLAAGWRAGIQGRGTAGQLGLLSKPVTCLLSLFTWPLRRGQGSRPALLVLFFFFVSSPAASVHSPPTRIKPSSCRFPRVSLPRLHHKSSSTPGILAGWVFHHARCMVSYMRSWKCVCVIIISGLSSIRL